MTVLIYLLNLILLLSRWIENESNFDDEIRKKFTWMHRNYAILNVTLISMERVNSKRDIFAWEIQFLMVSQFVCLFQEYYGLWFEFGQNYGNFPFRNSCCRETQVIYNNFFKMCRKLALYWKPFSSSILVSTCLTSWIVWLFIGKSCSFWIWNERNGAKLNWRKFYSSECERIAGIALFSRFIHIYIWNIKEFFPLDLRV